MSYFQDLASDAWLYLRYGSKKQTEITVGKASVRYWTGDAYSRRWFYPRYEGGRLHEEKVTRLMVEHMRNSRCFVDVGANLGFFTCLGARLIPDGKVYSYEMNDLFFALLQKNVELNAAGNVEAVRAAVTDRGGEASYARQEQNQYRPTLRLTTDPERREKLGKVTIRAVSLDEYFADSDAVPDLVKIDVEGAEARVLGGMRGLVERCHPTLFVEIHPKELVDFGSSASGVVSTLIDYGYDVSEIEEMRCRGDASVLCPLNRGVELTDNTMILARWRDAL